MKEYASLRGQRRKECESWHSGWQQLFSGTVVKWLRQGRSCVSWQKFKDPNISTTQFNRNLTMDNNQSNEKKQNYSVIYTWFCGRQDFRPAHEQYAFERFPLKLDQIIYRVIFLSQFFQFGVGQSRDMFKGAQLKKSPCKIYFHFENFKSEVSWEREYSPDSALPVHPTGLVQKGYQVSCASSTAFSR